LVFVFFSLPLLIWKKRFVTKTNTTTTTTTNLPLATTLEVAFFSLPTPFLALHVYVPGSLSSADRTRFSFVPRITFPRDQVMFGLGSPTDLQVSSTCSFSLSVRDVFGRVLISGSSENSQRC